MNTQDRNINPNTENFDFRCRRYFSWTAIIAGALVGLGVSFLLNLFGISIGLAAFATGTTSSSPTLATGGFIGLLIIAIVSMGALGWVAGYLGALKCCHIHKDATDSCNYGCLYGFLAWSLALVLSILLSAQVGNFLSFSMAALTNPSVAVEKYAAPERTTGTTRVETKHVTTSPNGVATTVDSQEAAKTFAETSFVAFALFFVGALSASFFGHFGFARSQRKYLNRM